MYSWTSGLEYIHCKRCLSYVASIYNYFKKMCYLIHVVLFVIVVELLPILYHIKEIIYVYVCSMMALPDML